MKKLITICLITFISFSLSHCKKNDIVHPEMNIKSPVGTWMLIKAGRWISDGASGIWVWENVSPDEAFKITFGNDHTFISQEQSLPVKGTYIFINGALEVKMQENESAVYYSNKMAGNLKNNQITLKFPVGADAFGGYQFRFFKNNLQ